MSFVHVNRISGVTGYDVLIIKQHSDGVAAIPVAPKTGDAQTVIAGDSRGMTVDVRRPIQESSVFQLEWTVVRGNTELIF